MSWPANIHVRFIGIVVGLCGCLLAASPVWSASDSVHEPPNTHESLLETWFLLERSGPVHAPYAYIRHNKTRSTVTNHKQQLMEELDHLIWHLSSIGKSRLVTHLKEWSRQIGARDEYRAPGQWGPAWLLGGARNRVPMSAVAAVGACTVPEWVEIWSADGVERIEWQPSMRLRTLLFDGGPLLDTDADRVTLVTPYGSIEKRGIAPWNFNDMPILPGMRIVVPLPLDGRVANWMQQQLPTFLAHLTPGETCREIALRDGSTNEPG